MSNSFSWFTDKFPVVEHFYTIQGEGENTGKPAYFIRLGGCDVGCPWCDVKESWSQEEHEILSIESIAEFVIESGAQNVVVTGGEPCMYDLTLLTEALKNKGLKTWLETSGAYPITGEWDWIVVSPKRRMEVLEENLAKANELKVVVVRNPDIAWANLFVPRVGSSTRLFLQPEWSREDEILPVVINHVKKSGKWRISLQTHKYMSIP
ncbi:MAG: 7-carboxy-7-deazaguanine synthase QueE [Crocinitomicaceae bacterium]|nr:7-carboxy-7-deazaguanine synthase QueE [Crocinitomicaceae bacterium]|tara:strand:+ start:22028 stop:22651 length:624 start_codon:yes stop_codon:yes gene_type:complete